MSSTLPQVEGKKKNYIQQAHFKKKILNEKKYIKEKKLYQVLVSTHKFMSRAF
jgi:hypothetical protein